MSIAQKLIDAAQRLVDFDAGHDPFYWDEKEIEENKALKQAFTQLAQEVEISLNLRRELIGGIIEAWQKRESLWRELVDLYDRHINLTEGSRSEKHVQELRKQLGLTEE